MGYYVLSQESLYKFYKYHGYTVRGTPNCPLKYTEGIGQKTRELVLYLVLESL